MNIRRIITISRPRFWSYLAGPYLIGYVLVASSVKDFYSFPFLYSVFYFLLPANFFLYGINDYFDRKIDRVNPRKKTHESIVESHESTTVLNFVLISLIFAMPMWAFLNPYALSILFCFLLLGAFYSAPPIRLKTIRFFDSFSNILYILPGLLGYAQLLPDIVSFSNLLYLACWPIAMHLFSAIADIDADKKANIQTTATYLGRTKGLLACLVLWVVFAAYVTSIDDLYVFSFVYPSIPLYLLYHREVKIERLYWKFPMLNTLIGAALFLYLYMSKF